MARIILLLSLLFTLLAQGATTRQELLVHFEKDRSALTDEALSELTDFVGSIELKGDYVLTVHGHTDSDGSFDYNESLSQARADKVRQFLIDRGADPDLVRIDRSGERAPTASNANVNGMAQNRRVEVTFERNFYSDTEELRKALMEGSVQHFTIDPTKDQVIQGTAGTQLKIKAGSLVDAMGRPATGEVDLELTEALGLQSMLAHRLSTRSGDRMLETGGMLKVMARDASGAELRLAAADPMEIAIPTEAKEEGMELFLSDDGDDWASTAQPIVSGIVTRWIEPMYPAPPRLAFKFPSYSESQKGRPMKPMEPLAPRTPAEPRKESYQAQKPWWSFLFPEKAQAAADVRYDRALQDHELRMKRYDKRLASYVTECSTFPERLERYNARKIQWDAQKEAEFETWNKEVSEPARARYNSMMAPLRAKHDTAVANWRAVREASMERYAFTSDSLGTAEVGGLNSYIFSTAKMGWINCDRFYDVPAELKHNVIAQGCTVKDAQVFVVFTRIRSMMALARINGDHFSQPVARAEPAMVLAYAVIDGQAHVSMEPVGPSGKVKVELAPSSYAEIGELLRSLGAQPG